MMKENKVEIVKELEKCLRKTRFGGFGDGIKLDYVYDEGRFEEYVEVTYDGGWKQRINVACDSGIAMIYDVITNLDR